MFSEMLTESEYPFITYDFVFRSKEVEFVPSESNTKLNREALGPEISKKKTPKKRIILPAPSTEEAMSAPIAISVPAVIQRTPGAVVSPLTRKNRVTNQLPEQDQSIVISTPTACVQQPRFSTFLNETPPDFDFSDFDK